MAADWQDLNRKLDAIAARQERLGDALDAFESRLARIADQVQRIAETSARLKLMADNAKRRDEARDAALSAIEESLARLEAARGEPS